MKYRIITDGNSYIIQFKIMFIWFSIKKLDQFTGIAFIEEFHTAHDARQKLDEILERRKRNKCKRKWKTIFTTTESEIENE